MIPATDGEHKKLGPLDYAKVVVPSVIGSMALMGLVHGAFGKINKLRPNWKAFNPNYSLPKPFPRFMRKPGFLEHVNAEAWVDAPITVGAMMKAQHDINKMQKTSGLVIIAQSVRKTPGVYVKGRPNVSGRARMKRGLSMTGVKI